MLALSDKLLENKSLMFVAAAIALLVAAVLLLLMFRLAFGRRLRLPGSSRGRIPRLGIVDAFDLDRQRQLVIVRRDNVEHLIMIGGPNDLVIESEIIRAEAREGRLRDKEPREAAQAPAAVAWPPEPGDAAACAGPGAAQNAIRAGRRGGAGSVPGPGRRFR
ncbi:flagellar biosynthetic protein FliO [Methylocapsa polymorpha]|uniref:Flagellar biosynthetic protein FliO n=1 Tax=Methylocapsa polymorpha TaxID=3080828 RepID=A0ABZ0HRZ9_9HYPH|nr:flagellar biosynthetic protein FliO [Methylocapsa sp. RX1]